MYHTPITYSAWVSGVVLETLSNAITPSISYVQFKRTIQCRQTLFKGRFKIQILLFIKITRFQHGLIHWHRLWTIVELFPCIFLITVDMEILIKAWSRCHKDHHKWKRSDSPYNTGCFTVFRTRFKYMWPRAVKKVGRVIYIAFLIGLYWEWKDVPYYYFTINDVRCYIIASTDQWVNARKT